MTFDRLREPLIPAAEQARQRLQEYGPPFDDAAMFHVQEMRVLLAELEEIESVVDAALIARRILKGKNKWPASSARREALRVLDTALSPYITERD